MQVYFWAVNSVPLVFVSALRGSAIIISKLQMGMLQCRGLMEPALGPTRGINEQAGGLSSHSLPPLPCSLMWFPRSGPWRSSPSTVSQGLAGHELLWAMRVTSLFFPLFYVSYFQPFSSHATCNLFTRILQHTKKYIFCRSDKKIGIILIHSHQTAIVVLTVVIFSLTA